MEIIDNKFFHLCWDSNREFIIPIENVISIEFVEREDSNSFDETQYLDVILHCVDGFSHQETVFEASYTDEDDIDYRQWRRDSLKERYELKKDIRNTYLEGKKLFKKTMQDEAFQLLLTNRLIQSNVK